MRVASVSGPAGPTGSSENRSEPSEKAPAPARSNRIAERFERPLLVAAVLTIPVTILQLLPADDPWRTIADVFNWFIWFAFLAEVVVMLVVVPSKRKWLRAHTIEVAIVVITPPFLTSIVQSARLVRLFRLARLMRLAPLIRALFSAEGVRYAAMLTALTALAGGAAFASVEKLPVGDGIYWAITTMATVGYGDIHPTTPEGKVIAITVMLVGIGFAALVVGAIADRFIRPQVHEVEATDDDLLLQIRDLGARLQRLERTLERRRSSDTDLSRATK